MAAVGAGQHGDPEAIQDSRTRPLHNVLASSNAPARSPARNKACRRGSPEDVVAKCATNPNKRMRDDVAIENRSLKRRRTGASRGAENMSSRTSTKGKIYPRRGLLDLEKMRDEAEDIDRAMGETEAMAARVLMRVQSILLDVFEDIEHLNAKRATALLKMDDQDVDVSQPHSTNDDDETAPAPEDAPPETTKPPTPADYEAAIAMLSDLRSRISNDVVPNEHLQALCAEIDVFRAQKHIPHVCPRTAEQQEATQWFPFSQPRPRIGVDPQGFPYEDWGHSPPSNSRFIRRLEKENLLLTRMSLSLRGPPFNGVYLVPAALSARRPRVFKKQCMVQFQHIPLSILTQMEIWHYEQGRCSDCIVRALKTFPPWVIDLVTNEALEDGNPVFRNGLKDELIEWDDATRRCRHLVFDHYRWIAIEELEERAYDSAADPLIVNGTRATPVPAYNRYHWIDGLRRP